VGAVVIWQLSSSSDPRALAVVDGTGVFEGHGPHYSRRTPGSKTFTGVGQEVVLVTECGRAVWAVVRQKTPARRGSGSSRGRTAASDTGARWIWRNMLFRNLGAGLSSDLIRSATFETYRRWRERYGGIPAERLRTEIGIKNVKSKNPGYCYLCAGYTRDRIVRGKLYLWAPAPLAALRDSLRFADDTASPGSPRATPSAGHCAAVAAIAHNLIGATMVSASVCGQSHWFTRVGDTDVDITGDQFGLPAVQAAPAGALYPDTRVREWSHLNDETLARARLLAARSALEVTL
jgi:hypothetical protein